jgi:N-acetylglucosamine malate deacetylase 2
LKENRLVKEPPMSTHVSTHAEVSSDVGHTLPPWERVLVVVAHPDDESFGLGAVVAAFTSRGSQVAVLSLTEGETSTLGAGINLARMRRQELTAASQELGVSEAVLHHHPDGALRSVCRHVLAGEVVDEVGAVRAEGLLVFDTSGVTGHPDHAAATSAALLAADVLDLPVLAWTLPLSVAEQLNEELDGSFSGCPDGEIDLTITVDRAHQIAASRAHHTQSVPSSPLWRRLELLGDCEHLRWLRHPSSGGETG